MGHGLSLIKGLGLGAGLMYYLDPDRGRARRARLRDRFIHLTHELDDAIEAGWHDLRNRARGLVAEAGSALRDGHAPDDVLVARVRSELGRVVSHPKAVRVTARAGRVTLAGPILADEAGPLLAAVSRVRGVDGVEDRLEVHDQPGGIPSLQGGLPRNGRRLQPWQPPRAPAARLLVGVAGGVVALKIARRAGLPGLALTTLGACLALASLSNSPRARASGPHANDPAWASP